MVKTQRATLIRNPQGYLWAEMGRQYRTLRGAKLGILYDARILGKRGVRVYTFLDIYDQSGQV